MNIVRSPGFTFGPPRKREFAPPRPSRKGVQRLGALRDSTREEFVYFSRLLRSQAKQIAVAIIKKEVDDGMTEAKLAEARERADAAIAARERAEKNPKAR